MGHFERLKTRSAIAPYGLAALAVAASLLFRSLLNPLLGPQYVYLTAPAAVVFASWYCGLGPAILSVFLVAAGSSYFFLPPIHSFSVRDPQDMWGMTGFLFFAGLIVAMGEANRRLSVRREVAERESKDLMNRLEDRIRQRTEELERKTAQVAQQAKLLDSANDAIFVRSKDNTITYWNQGAARLYGWQEYEVLGKSPREILQTEFPVPESEVLRSENDSWQGELRHRTRSGNQVTVASRWTTLRDANNNVSGWLEINTDITARKNAEEGARRLGGRMLQLQDEERRRFARELHDGIGQYLSSLKMMLDGALGNELPSAQQKEVMTRCVSILEKCLAETRTVSHLLHPPLLDEAGLSSAVQWYTDGFSQRSGIQLEVALEPDLGRLPSEVEITLFRVLQESLTNIHRHSGASSARITIAAQDGQIRMQIIDSGRGIPDERLRQWRELRAPLGVGMAGMVERTRELGGTFDVISSSSGTSVTVAIPAPKLDPRTADPRHKDSATHGISAN
jgi:PAS domain S-box-containing protein